MVGPGPESGWSDSSFHCVTTALLPEKFYVNKGFCIQINLGAANKDEGARYYELHSEALFLCGVNTVHMWSIIPTARSALPSSSLKNQEDRHRF